MSQKRILTLVLGGLALLAAVIVAVAALSTGLARLAAFVGAGWLLTVKAHWLIALVLVYRLFVYGALPFHWRIVGSAVVHAPPEDIWALLVPRRGRPYHSNSVARIVAAPDDPNRVVLHFDDAFADPGDSHGPSLETVIEVREFGRRLLLRHQNPENMPLMGRDAVASETLIEPAEGGGHRVTFIEHMRAFRLWSLLVFFHLNPCEDAARRLKSLCEGTADASWMGTTMDDLRETPGVVTSGGGAEFTFAGIIVAVVGGGVLIGFTLLLLRGISGL